MDIFKDKRMPAIGGLAPADEIDFKLVWLHRRVENLEAIIYELLRDRVSHEVLNDYMKQVRNPGPEPDSSHLKDRGEQIANMIGKAPSGGDGWPARKKGVARAS
jgi:hypothetical protein